MNGNFGYKLKILRKTRNLTQQEFGAKLNVSGGTISNWERLLKPSDAHHVGWIETTFNCPGYFSSDALSTAPAIAETPPSHTPPVQSFGERLAMWRNKIAEDMNVSPDKVRLEIAA